MRKAIFKAVIVILQAWIVNPCYAQNIKLTGSIKGEITKQILPNATISIKSIGTNLFKTTLVAGEDGTFIINLPWEGLYRVEASYLGYSNNIKDSILVDSQHASMNVIYMSLASKDLKTVSVSTTKKPFISIEANKIILNVSESAVFASGNAYEVLLNAPGVTEQNDLLSFRGKSLNVLINGRPSNLTGQDLKTMLTNMQASGIQK